MIRKLFITPWFGPLPSWMDAYWRNADRLERLGYDWLVTHDLTAFNRRVRDRLGIDCPIVPGGGKIHDYRAAFGVLFADEIDGYDFWGHTDFDCVYGRVNFWVSDDYLAELDLHSNHDTYVCGPWSLYRAGVADDLFMQHPDWKEILEAPSTTGWVEKSYTALVDAAHTAGHLRRDYTYWQTEDLNDFSQLHWDGPRLCEGNTEVMMAHFRRVKEYPEGCL